VVSRLGSLIAWSERWAVRMVERHPQPDPATEGLALDVGALDALGVQEVEDLLGVGRDVLAPRVVRLGGVAMPEQVDGDRPVLRSEPDDVAAPGLGVATDAVDQEQGVAVSGLDHPGAVAPPEVADLTAEKIDPDGGLHGAGGRLPQCCMLHHVEQWSIYLDSGKSTNGHPQCQPNRGRR